MQTLKQQRPWVESLNAVAATLPRYTTMDTGVVELIVVANAIRLQVTGCTEAQLNSLVGKYLFADDAAATSEVRLVNRVEVIDGTPDTYFVIVDEPFTVTPATYDVEYINADDWEPVFAVVNIDADLSIDGVATALPTKNSLEIYNTSPKRPIVVFGTGNYKITNMPQGSMTL